MDAGATKHLYLQNPKTFNRLAFAFSGLLCLLPLASCGAEEQPNEDISFFRLKNAKVYSYHAPVPNLEKWEVGQAIEEEADLPSFTSPDSMVCVSFNGDVTPSESLSSDLFVSIGQKISPACAALILYHYKDVSFLKDTDFHYYRKDGTYKATYRTPVIFFNYGATKSFFNKGDITNENITGALDYEDQVSRTFHELLYNYLLEKA